MTTCTIVQSARNGTGSRRTTSIEIFEGDERRQTIGEVRQERQRVALVDQGSLARTFGLLAFGNLDAQALVGLRQSGGALGDPRLELAVRAAQRLFALAQRSFGVDALGDVDRVSEHVRFRPDHATARCGTSTPVRSRAIHHSHEPGIVTVLLDAPQIVVEQVPCIRREKLAQVVADAVFRLIAERVGRGGIDREDGAGQIVRADQAEAVFDQLTISPLAVAERVAGFLPCRGDPFETDWDCVRRLAQSRRRARSRRRGARHDRAQPWAGSCDYSPNPRRRGDVQPGKCVSPPRTPPRSAP